METMLEKGALHFTLRSDERAIGALKILTSSSKVPPHSLFVFVFHGEVS